MIKVITMQRYAEIRAEADQLANKYKGCRQRAKVMSASIIQKIKNEPGKMVEDGECIGHKIVCTYTENLGTKKYPDTYKELLMFTPIRQTPKMFYERYRQTNKDNVLCVLEDV